MWFDPELYSSVLENFLPKGDCQRYVARKGKPQGFLRWQGHCMFMSNYEPREMFKVLGGKSLMQG